jgi:cell division septation protein DedD
MSSTSETETEILLGNRHLLAIFFVLAVLLGIAFTGGYMVGRNSPDKKPAGVMVAASDAAASSVSSGASSLETHSIPPAGTEQTDPAAATAPAADETLKTPPPAAPKEEPPLGAPKQKPTSDAPPLPAIKTASKAESPVAANPAGSFAGPESGQTFLQVAAVGHTEANALADVLSRKGFRAHAVPKPGASDLYRVLIGPMRDTSDLSATRDSLRNAGFTKIFVQKY